MITKRLAYEPIERLDSAITRLDQLAAEMEEVNPLSTVPAKIYEIIHRDLNEAREKLTYLQELAS